MEKREFGCVRPRERGDGWRIDLYPIRSPRFLFTVSGQAFATREQAEWVLDGIRYEINVLRKSPEDAVARFASPRAKPNRVPHRLGQWLAEQRRREAAGQLSPGTLRYYERTARKASEEFAGMSVAELTTGLLESWALSLSEQGLRPKSVRNLLGTVGAFLGWCKRRGLINQVPDLPTIRDPKPYTPKLLDAAEQAAVLLAIPEPARGAYMCCALLGMRPGEARAVRVEDVDLNRERVTVRRAFKGPRSDSPVGPTKTGQERTLPLPTSLSKWLREHLQGDGWAFPNPHTGLPWTHDALRDTWLRACRDALGREVGLYVGTKHSAASAALLAGVDSRLVQVMLGHADRRSTDRYARVGPEALRRAVNRGGGG